jgi:hypothetical protein
MTFRALRNSHSLKCMDTYFFNNGYLVQFSCDYPYDQAWSMNTVQVSFAAALAHALR